LSTVNKKDVIFDLNYRTKRSLRGYFLENKGFNLTQGMVLLLLKPLNLPANFVLKLIIFITNPENNIGYK